MTASRLFFIYWGFVPASTSIEKDDNVFNFQEVEWFTPDWEDEDFVPVNFITTGDNLTTNEHLRIRGMDEGNALFYEDFNLSYHNSEFYLPIGEFEFTIYDINDPSTATTETIEIKESIDYLNNPIQLKINLSEMTEEAEPFNYELTGVSEDSITLNWNHVSKISGFKIVAYESDDYFNTMYHSESNFIPNNSNEYTFTGLDPNKIYYIDLIAIYKNNLELGDSFVVKTNGEDSKDNVVNFGDEKLHNEIANMLGIYFRDVTEADLEDIDTLYLYSRDIKTLSGLEFAHYLKSLNVSDNNISNIESLANFVDLNYLDLYKNYNGPKILDSKKGYVKVGL